jgi:hypothetical protein
MASRKSQRKQANLTRKAQAPAGAPMRHRDGDRRRRWFGPIAAQAIAAKLALRHLGELVPPPADGDDDVDDNEDDDELDLTDGFSSGREP